MTAVSTVLREAERCLILFLLITRYRQFQLIALEISNVSARPETRRKKCHLLAFSGHYPCPGDEKNLVLIIWTKTAEVDMISD